MKAKRTQKNKGLITSFKKYQKRSSSREKNFSWTNFLPEIIFRTMRLEDERITRKQAKALFC